MEVTINEKKINYDPDFKKNKSSWKVKLRDYFYVVELEGTKCFVKRFADEPSAFELLLILKGKPVVNIPKVYDLVSNEENGRTVHYLFTEFIEGQILKDDIVANKPSDTKKIAREVLDGLKFIREKGYWFADLNEENIFRSNNGNYLLIDVDSCWPDNVPPGTDPSNRGFMPEAAQEYANIVMLFYREILEVPDFSFEKLKGSNLNYLQLLAIIAKLEVFFESKKNNPRTAYINKKIYKDLHYFLLNKNEPYSKNVFQRALNDKLPFSLITELSKFIIGDHLVPPNSDLPVIEYFIANNYNIFSRGSATLSWSIKNASVVSLSTAAENILQNAPAESSLIVKPQALETYILTAAKFREKVVKTLQINVTQLAMPHINYFKADTVTIKKGEKATLSWSVENANKLFLNNKEYALNVASISVAPIANTEYTLIIENKAGERTSSQIDIEVKSQKKWWLYMLMVFVLLFLIWLIRYSLRYP